MSNQLELEKQSEEEYDEVYKIPGYTTNSPAFRMVNELIGMAKKFEATTVLDAGFGTGRSIKRFAEEGFDIYGADVVFTGLDPDIKEKYGNKLVKAPLSNLPFKQKFDFIYCIDVMEHIKPDLIEASLKELQRVSVGFIFFVIPLFKSVFTLKSKNLHYMKEQKDWICLISKYFNIKQVLGKTAKKFGVIAEVKCEECRL